MNIAFEGCFHGNLEQVYKTMAYIEQQHNIKIDALISCGDFQAIRNKSDMYSMKCKEKYLEIGNFHEYYTGQKKAPYLTIFIGGNHEASNHNRELYFGGWAAPNIYFLGSSNVITLKKGNNQFRLGGISGIYKSYDFLNSKLESFPFDGSSIVSCFHQKQIDILKLAQLAVNNPKPNLDVFLSHDWPSDVVNHGNVADLLRRKKFFADDVKNNCLGSYPLNYLLKGLKPKYWISGHLHVKYTAVYPHSQGSKEDVSLFLALDKCLPNRDFLQIIPLGKNSWNLSQEESREGEQSQGDRNVDESEDEDIQLIYDEEWLRVQKSVCEVFNYHLKQDFFAIDNNNQVKLKNEEMQKRIQEQIQKNQDYFKGKNLNIPANFQVTCIPYQGPNDLNNSPDKIDINNQTLQYLELLGVNPDRFRDLLHYNHEKPAFQEQPQQRIVTYTNSFVKNKEEINLDDFSEDEDNNNHKQEEPNKIEYVERIKEEKKPMEVIKQNIPQQNQNTNLVAQKIQSNATIIIKSKIEPSDIKLDELPFL